LPSKREQQRRDRQRAKEEMQREATIKRRNEAMVQSLSDWGDVNGATTTLRTLKRPQQRHQPVLLPAI
jgi:hypothetical protein